MFFGNFGSAEDGRPRFVLGVTHKDVAVLVHERAIDLNAVEDKDNPLPAHIILMFGGDEKEIEGRIAFTLDRIKEGKNGDDDV